MCLLGWRVELLLGWPILIVLVGGFLGYGHIGEVLVEDLGLVYFYQLGLVEDVLDGLGLFSAVGVEVD